MALDPGANPAPTFGDIRQFPLTRAQKPRERFKTGFVIPGTDIISLGGVNFTSTGRPNEFRVMHALANNDLIVVLGPRKASSFVKSGDAAGNFKITNGNELRAAKAVPNGVYSVSVAAVNAQGEEGSTRTVSIFVDPHPPTDINLSGLTVAATAAVNTVVGNLTTTDADAGDTFTYTLVESVSPGPAPPYFKISGATVQVAKALTGLAGNPTTIDVTSTDASGLAVTKPFQLIIT